MSRCQFVPPYLLERLAGAGVHPDVSRSGRDTLAVDEQMRRARLSHAVHAERPATEAGPPAWAVYTDSNGTALPGTEVREAGQPGSGDAAVDEAAVSVSATLAMYHEVLHRASYDGGGARVLATVHYGSNYDNAFWNGTQLVFGDGDGHVFGRFTTPIDVGAHEFTHAVTQYTANLAYAGQSGALNESMSDCFGICVKQRVLGQSAEQADWLIGEGIFLPSVQGRGLRSMKDPGTAYDDPVLGKDPQVGSMADYVHTDSDNGGVHLNSGIPNRAFYLAAVGLGGNAWETALPVWYAALTSGIGADTDFAGFASATVAAARAVSADAASAVRSAWAQVGVTAAPAPAGAPAGAGAVSGSGAGGSGSGAGSGASGPADADGVVEVRRTGGFAGVERTGAIRLGEDPRTDQVRNLLERIDLAALAPLRLAPDRFVYVFTLHDTEVTVAEDQLTPELETLAGLLLGD
ncbi:MAG TPA: protealysin inhibitor emfourin [Nocardioidaceae bacterium]|nr:protealysin inhibitor emfourin [Nocardioidaceae bacterium]